MRTQCRTEHRDSLYSNSKALLISERQVDVVFAACSVQRAAGSGQRAVRSAQCAAFLWPYLRVESRNDFG